MESRSDERVKELHKRTVKESVRNEYSNNIKPSRYYDGGNMDNDFCYASDFACGYGNRTVHRNFADSDINSGADIDIYPENFGGLPLHSAVIAVDRSANARNDPRNFRPARKIHKLTRKCAGLNYRLSY